MKRFNQILIRAFRLEPKTVRTEKFTIIIRIRVEYNGMRASNKKS